MPSSRLSVPASAAWLSSLAFVLIWSTGFIVGRAIVPLAQPSLFLLARFSLAAVLFAAVAMAGAARWPALREVPRHLLAGALLHGSYLGGGYWAIAHGLAPSAMALLGALQPPLTALLAIPLLGEFPSRQGWGGLALGSLGVVLVVAPATLASAPSPVSPWVVLVAVISILSITMGTILQKTSIAAADLRASMAWQNVGGALVAGALAWLLGESHWQPGMALWSALAWATLVLSGLGTYLLVRIVRRGQAATAASLMFLAPPLAALQAWLLFGDKLGVLQLLGLLVAGIGVWLCQAAQGAGTPRKTRHAAAR
ncbi:DMT family transporter [Cupriavidus basilensis]|uniref:DMT family transporter n=1 Tax=Cupriavidus basilensis TaxID=68895 RepID=A0A643FPU3_9BURK|nr:DMT family transporter [Cupriavidus basilensis]QOT80888.1 DMT family transporter [Cupriavidus basilensis]